MRRPAAEAAAFPTAAAAAAAVAGQVVGAVGVPAGSEWRAFYEELIVRRDAYCWGGYQKYRGICCDLHRGPRGATDCWDDFVDPEAPWDANMHSYELCCDHPGDSQWAAGETEVDVVNERAVAVFVFTNDLPSSRRFWPLVLAGIAKNIPLKELGWRVYLITEGRHPGVTQLARAVGLGRREFRWMVSRRGNSFTAWSASCIAALSAVTERWVLFLEEDTLIPEPIPAADLNDLLDFAIERRAASIVVERGLGCYRWRHLKGVHQAGRLQMIEPDVACARNNSFVYGHSPALHDKHYLLSIMRLFPGKGFHPVPAGSADFQECHGSTLVCRLADMLAGSASTAAVPVAAYAGAKRLFGPEGLRGPPLLRVFGVEYPGGLGGHAALGGRPLPWEQRSCPCAALAMCTAGIDFRCTEADVPLNEFGCLHGPGGEQAVETPYGLDQLVLSARGGRVYPWFADLYRRVRRLAPQRRLWMYVNANSKIRLANESS